MVENKNKIVAGILALFLGSFGVHKFYLNNTKAGVIMLVVSFLGLILLGVPTLIIGLIAFIEAILYMVKSDEDFNQIYVVNKKSWF